MWGVPPYRIWLRSDACSNRLASSSLALSLHAKHAYSFYNSSKLNVSCRPEEPDEFDGFYMDSPCLMVRPWGIGEESLLEVPRDGESLNLKASF